MKKSPNTGRLGILYGLTVFLIGFMAVLIYSPKEGFYRPNDINSSAYGMAMARSHFEADPIEERCQGYVLNGEPQCYNNWSPWVFKTFAAWFRLTKDDIFEARILTAIIYAISCLLFFILIHNRGTEVGLAFLCTLLFLSLPFHLKFANLIYADIWLLPFWLLALLCYRPDNLRWLFLFVPIVLLGSLFMWFVIFLLPAPFLIHWSTKIKGNNYRNLLVLVIASVVSIWLIQAILIHTFEQNYRVQSLSKWTVFNLISEESLTWKLIARLILMLSFESMSLLCLYLLAKKSSKRTNDMSHSTENNGVFNAIVTMGIGLTLYIFSVPIWFFIHIKGVFVFAILIGLILTLLLKSSSFQSEKRRTRLAATLTLINLVGIGIMEFTFHLRHNHQMELQDRAIQFVTAHRHSNDKLVIFFIRKVGQESPLHPFALNEYTRNYLFEYDDSQFSNAEHSIGNGLQKLEKNGYYDFDKDVVVVIGTELAQTEMPVIRHEVYQDIHFYAIKTR